MCAGRDPGAHPVLGIMVPHARRTALHLSPGGSKSKDASPSPTAAKPSPPRSPALFEKAIKGSEPAPQDTSASSSRELPVPQMLGPKPNSEDGVDIGGDAYDASAMEHIGMAVDLAAQQPANPGAAAVGAQLTNGQVDRPAPVKAEAKPAKERANEATGSETESDTH